MSSDTFTVIDIKGNISDEFSSDVEPEQTSTPKPCARRYNLRKTIRKPLRYDEQYCNTSKVHDRRNTRDAVYPDFNKCTVDYNETEGSYTVYGFKHGKEYFTTRGAEYIGLTDDVESTLDSDEMVIDDFNSSRVVGDSLLED